MTTISAPQEGSTLYYSLLYSNDDAQQAYLQCSALITALSSALHDVNDAQVAQKKIHWWHEEIDRSLVGKARHPATEPYQLTLTSWPQAREHCLNILSVAAEEHYGSAQSKSAFEQRTVMDYTARLALLHQSVTQQSAQTDQWQSIALALGLFDRLARLPYYLHRDYDGFSHEHYKACGITPGNLKNCAIDKRGTLFEQLINDALQALQHSSINPQNKPCLPLTTLINIRKKQLLLWQKNKPDLLNETVTLTPLRKFFVAWNSKRQY